MRNIKYLSDSLAQDWHSIKSIYEAVVDECVTCIHDHHLKVGLL